jgi:hypothetical protein
MENLGTTIITLLFTAGIPWWIGLGMHKSFNEKESRTCHFRTDKKWVFMLGLRPNERIYLRFAIMQFLALLYFLAGGLSLIKLDWILFDKLTGYFFVIFICYAIIIGLLDLSKRRIK